MSSLEIENNRSEVPGSVNMVQYVFDKINGLNGVSKEEVTRQAIKEVSILSRTVREGKNEFYKAKDALENAKRAKTYIPTGEEIAKDVEEGLYR